MRTLRRCLFSIQLSVSINIINHVFPIFWHAQFGWNWPIWSESTGWKQWMCLTQVYMKLVQKNLGYSDFIQICILGSGLTSWYIRVHSTKIWLTDHKCNHTIKFHTSLRSSGHMGNNWSLSETGRRRMIKGRCWARNPRGYYSEKNRKHWSFSFSTDAYWGQASRNNLQSEFSRKLYQKTVPVLNKIISSQLAQSCCNTNTQI